MFDLTDVRNVDQYQHLDWSSAHIIGTSDTHGLIISKDRLDPSQARIFLVGCSNGRFPPKIKAHNGFSKQDLREIIRAALSALQVLEGSR